MKEEYRPLRGSEGSASGGLRISRRAALGASAGILLTGGGIFRGAQEYLYKPEGDYHSVDAFLNRRGFDKAGIGNDRFRELSPHFFQELATGPKNDLEVNIVNDKDVLAEISFTVSEPTLASLSVSDRTNPLGALPVVEVSHNDLDYQVGILESAHNNKGNCLLGEVSGQNHLAIRRTSASSDLALEEGSLKVNLFYGDPLRQAAYRLSPILGMRPDNYSRYISAQSDEERSAALTNDMPLATPVEIRENDSGQLALIYWMLYTSEDGGWGRNPEKMYQKTGGRLYDSDIAAITILNPDFTVAETAHQEDNNNGKHQMKVDFSFSPGVRPYDQYLHSVPDHGLAGYGLQAGIRKVWRPVPLIKAITSDTALDELYSGARIAAIKENIREAEHVLSMLDETGDPFAINETNRRINFLQTKLQAEYSNETS